MDKHEKKLSNIWKNFDPNVEDKELNRFILNNHSSVTKFHNEISNEISHLMSAISRFQNEEKRNELIDRCITREYGLWVKPFYEKEHKPIGSQFKGFLDMELSRNLFAIELVNGSGELKSDYIRFKWDDEYSEEQCMSNLYSWFFKATVENNAPNQDGVPEITARYSDGNLDERWENMWRFYEDDYGWSNKKWMNRERDALMKMIWDDLKPDLKNRVEDIDSLVPEDFKKEIQFREEKARKIVKKYISKAKIECFKQEPDFMSTSDNEIGWDVEYLTSDLWEEKDFRAIWEKNKEED